jgi:hypothetical protein
MEAFRDHLLARGSEKIELIVGHENKGYHAEPGSLEKVLKSLY